MLTAISASQLHILIPLTIFCAVVLHVERLNGNATPTDINHSAIAADAIFTAAPKDPSRGRAATDLHSNAQTSDAHLDATSFDISTKKTSLIDGGPNTRSVHTNPKAASTSARPNTSQTDSTQGNVEELLLAGRARSLQLNETKVLLRRLLKSNWFQQPAKSSSSSRHKGLGTAPLTGSRINPSHFFRPGLGGDDTHPGEFPFVISMEKPDDENDGMNVCSGAILSEQWVLTVAHCFELYGQQNWAVTAGGYDLMEEESKKQFFLIEQIINHPKFDSVNFRNDIALVRLEGSIKFSEDVRPIKLAATKLGEHLDCTVLGWRTMDTDNPLGPFYVLQKAQTKTISSRECKRFWKDHAEDRICTHNPDDPYKGPCWGDSGSPLVCSVGGVPLLTGILSHGPDKCKIKDGTMPEPAYYANVAFFNEWIQHHIGDDISENMYDPDDDDEEEETKVPRHKVSRNIKAKSPEAKTKVKDKFSDAVDDDEKSSSVQAESEETVKSETTDSSDQDSKESKDKVKKDEGDTKIKDKGKGKDKKGKIEVIGKNSTVADKGDAGKKHKTTSADKNTSKKESKEIETETDEESEGNGKGSTSKKDDNAVGENEPESGEEKDSAEKKEAEEVFEKIKSKVAEEIDEGVADNKSEESAITEEDKDESIGGKKAKPVFKIIEIKVVREAAELAGKNEGENDGKESTIAGDSREKAEGSSHEVGVQQKEKEIKATKGGKNRFKKGKPQVAKSEAKQSVIPGKFPYVVYLEKPVKKRTKFGANICSGAIITAVWVITAACCFDLYGSEDWIVIVGSHDLRNEQGTEQTFTIEKILLHSNFDRGTHANDIALIKLNSEINFNELIQPVQRAQRIQPPSTQCTILGFGTLNEVNQSKLQASTTFIMPSDECEEYWESHGEDKMCAFNPQDPNQGPCWGDSGSPLICEVNGERVLAGILAQASKDCIKHKKRKKPARYANVTYFEKWIDEYVRTTQVIYADEPDR